MQLFPRQVRVTIQGAPVLAVPDLLGAPIVGCTQPVTLASKPCTVVAAIFPGSWSTGVLVGGRPAYIATLAGLTDGVPPSPLIVESPGQVILEAEG